MLTDSEARARRTSPFLPNVCSLQAVLFLVIVAELLALALTVAAAGLWPFDWQGLGLRSFLLLWIMLLSASVLCPIRFWLGSLSPMVAGGLCYTLVLVITLLCTWVGLGLLGDPLSAYQPRILANLVLAAILGGIMLRYLYVQQQWRNQQEAESSARLGALQARIQPHFLFNSMNSIASLISSSPQMAETLVEDLCDLFRASLSDNPLTNLDTELALCRQYLDVESVRLGDRLTVEWRYPEALHPAASMCQVPRLLLQPLLENAIVHGIAALPEGGCIELDVAYSRPSKAGIWTIRVGNPRPLENAPAQGNLMALDNIRHRLAACFGARAELITEHTDHYFSVTLKVPEQMD